MKSLKSLTLLLFSLLINNTNIYCQINPLFFDDYNGQKSLKLSLESLTALSSLNITTTNIFIAPCVQLNISSSKFLSYIIRIGDGRATLSKDYTNPHLLILQFFCKNSALDEFKYELKTLKVTEQRAVNTPYKNGISKYYYIYKSDYTYIVSIEETYNTFKEYECEVGCGKYLNK